jgi:hypothetical protein
MERAYMPPAEPPQLEDDTWAHPSESCGSGAPGPNRRIRPLQTFITTPADSRAGCEADIHTGLLHVGAQRSRDGAKLPWDMPAQPADW